MKFMLGLLIGLIESALLSALVVFVLIMEIVERAEYGEKHRK